MIMFIQNMHVAQKYLPSSRICDWKKANVTSHLNVCFKNIVRYQLRISCILIEQKHFGKLVYKAG